MHQLFCGFVLALGVNQSLEDSQSFAPGVVDIFLAFFIGLIDHNNKPVLDFSNFNSFKHYNSWYDITANIIAETTIVVKRFSTNPAKDGVQYQAG